VFSATTLAIVEPLDGQHEVEGLLREPYQLPDPTTVTLCRFWKGVSEDIFIFKLSMMSFGR